MTATTTYPLIRAGWISAVEDLSPTSPTDRLFKRYENTRAIPFRDWARQNPAACLRRFAIERVLLRDNPLVADGLVEQHIARAEVIVAYPLEHMGGESAQRDTEDLIDADAEQMIMAIGVGGANNYVSGQSACFVTPRIEVDPETPVIFVILELQAIYYRSAEAVVPAATQTSAGQSFVVTWTPAGDSYTISIPTPMHDLTYIAEAWIPDELADGTPEILIDKDGRTTTTCIARATGDVPDGTQVEVWVRDR